MTLAKDLHGPRQDVVAAGRAVTLPGQDLGDLCVSQALAGQLEDPRLHFSATGEGMQGIHPRFDPLFRNLATSPDNADVNTLRSKRGDEARVARV
ncbi:hypothetical protein [Siccirubricoccus sp. G192]|uniref:hypothetical protein n=1 Tax=Siccirubricoccus sp. G192 TaxID=2849651 RepID=UPI001C2BD237|nr:hypothetical protein [Siccirubricoccus sp. G192]MBV1798716.1 hypothetical protein [Siccirubricoccus sp. G192]